MAIVRRAIISTIEIDPKSIDNTIYVNEITELYDDETQEILAQVDQNRYVLNPDGTDSLEVRSQVKEIAQKYAAIWSPVFNS